MKAFQTLVGEEGCDEAKRGGDEPAKPAAHKKKPGRCQPGLEVLGEDA